MDFERRILENTLSEVRVPSFHYEAMRLVFFLIRAIDFLGLDLITSKKAIREFGGLNRSVLESETRIARFMEE